MRFVEVITLSAAAFGDLLEGAVFPMGLQAHVGASCLARAKPSQVSRSELGWAHMIWLIFFLNSLENFQFDSSLYERVSEGK